MTKSTAMAKPTAGNPDQQGQARKLSLALKCDKNLNLYFILFLFMT